MQSPFDDQISRFESSGVEKVEWLSAGNAKVCTQCAQRSGKTMTLKEAQALILGNKYCDHGKCRCVLLPVEE
jgi:hypothetical protein